MATDTWTGGSGSWGVASNWSGDNGTPGVPVVTDDVVIDTAGITVTVGSGVAAVCHTLSDTNATLSITGGTLFTVERAIFNGAFIETAGTFTMSGYGANFDQSMTMLGGSMNVLSGAANIYDGGTLAGTISGAGALNLINGTTYIDSGFACTIASIVVGAQGGKLAFNTNFSYGNDFTLLQNGVLDIFGHTLTLTGGSLLEGTVGYGKIVQSGGNAAMTIGNGQNYTVFDNGLILSIGAHAQQDGNLALGANDSGAKLQIGKGGVYDIAGNWNIADPSSIGTITNAGVFAKDGGGKTSAIFSSFTSTGQLEVQIGTVLLEGLVNSVSGTVSGGGTLGIGGGRTTFGANVVLESAALNQISGVLVLNKA
ncbi:MAG TPA: hypothetical protein VMB71_14790, partial [Acetobacteraceae bacterium]|nr:hypothetical protein [Acetobacteraceae bacterium]